MLFSKLLLGSSEKLAERLLDNLTVPALGYWLVGLALLIRPEAITAAETRIEAGDIGAAALRAGLALALVILSGSLVAYASGGVLRIMVGDQVAPLSWLSRGLARRQVDRRARQLKDLQGLAARIQDLGWDALTSVDLARYSRLVQATRGWPADPRQVAPTRLGNLLRALESRVEGKYGLQPAIVWPRLEALIPAEAMTSLEASQSDLQALARLITWSVLLPLWIFPVLWYPIDTDHRSWSLALIPLAFVFATITYWRSVEAMERLIEQVEALFDVHRTELYKALRWPLPVNAQQEKAAGARLTDYLLVGSDDPGLALAGAPAPAPAES